MKKRGFTLVELLAVIIIIGLIAVIVVPILSNTITDAKRDTFEETVEAIVREMRNYATKIEMKTGIPFENKVLSVTSSELEYKGDRSKFEGKVLIDANGKIAIEMNNGTYCAKKSTSDSSIEVTKLRNQVCDGSSLLVEYDINYTDSSLNGADPILKDGLIPVVIEADGTVKKANTSTQWYDYSNKKWANAVILNGVDTYEKDQVIDANSIKAYFVWIPKYSYQLFDLGEYTDFIVETPTDPSNAKEVSIKFGTTNSSDANSGECTTPMTPGASGNCAIGDYMTHPAFISLNVNGIWVGKFETTGTIASLSVLPENSPLQKQTASAMYNAALGFQSNMKSHMMKNTEWGAVAILSHSKYGINSEIRVNNSVYKTGNSSADGIDQSSYPGVSGNTEDKTQPYNTSTGYKASTTGNITGIYDMSGGLNEIMASFVENTFGASEMTASIVNAHPEYFDVYMSGTYNNMSRRILGDATAEMGPFYKYKDSSNYNFPHNSWYADYPYFPDSTEPWLLRGGLCNGGVLAGQFNYGKGTGGVVSGVGFRLTLAP